MSVGRDKDTGDSSGDVAPHMIDLFMKHVFAQVKRERGVVRVKYPVLPDKTNVFAKLTVPF